MLTFDNFLHILESFVYFWQLFGNLCLGNFPHILSTFFLPTFGLFLTTFDNFWQSFTTVGNIQKRLSSYHVIMSFHVILPSCQSGSFTSSWCPIIYIWLMLMLWPLAVTPGVTHFGAYHRPLAVIFDHIIIWMVNASKHMLLPVISSGSYGCIGVPWQRV